MYAASLVQWKINLILANAFWNYFPYGEILFSSGVSNYIFINDANASNWVASGYF